MTTREASNRCSTCETNVAMCTCMGCEAMFCLNHFNEHREELSRRFEDEIEGTLSGIRNQINDVKPWDILSNDLFAEINQWESATIDQVHEKADGIRHQLIELINQKHNRFTDQCRILNEEIYQRRIEENFLEHDIKRLRHGINQLNRSLEELTHRSEIKMIINQIDWNSSIYIEQTAERNIPLNGVWTRKGVTVAGGNGDGSEFNQLSHPHGLYVADDQTFYIADFDNHRIIEWKCGATSGQVVAGGNGLGNRIDQLNQPTDVIVDKQTDSLIICDQANRRVVRWPRRDGQSGQTIMEGDKCFGLTMDDDGFLYVSDREKDEVRRWRVGETDGTVVAGGNGRGNRLDQFNSPSFVFVDRTHAVYVSDRDNHRVMKWVKDAKEGIVVAGGQGQGDALTQLNSPQGVVVDRLGTVYVADFYNNRIMGWVKGAKQGSIVVGGKGQGERANQISNPRGLSFDRQGNLYVVDYNNNRIQRFSIDSRS